MKTSRNQMHLAPLQYMVDESIEYLRSNEPTEGYYILADSFGKDSTVIWELAKMAGVKFRHIHHRTGIDPPELMKFGRKTRPDIEIMIPKLTMWEGIRKWFPPTLNYRWCCNELKHGQGPKGKTIIGVRSEESFKRKKRGRDFKKDVRPIFGWTEWHVWEFIEGLNLPYCELYDQGFGRIGCVVCPMICSSNIGKVLQHRKRWPGYYKAFEHAVTYWFYNVTWWERFKHKTPARYLDAWYRAFH